MKDADLWLVQISIFLSSKVMPTKMEWESVFLAIIFKHNAVNCSCSCLLCVFLNSLTLSLWQEVFFSHPFFISLQMTKHFSAGRSLFLFFKCLLFLFFPFSSFEYESNFLHPYAARCSNRIGCLYSSPFLLFPSLWIRTSRGIAWTWHKLKLCPAKSPTK